MLSDVNTRRQKCCIYRQLYFNEYQIRLRVTTVLSFQNSFQIKKNRKERRNIGSTFGSNWSFSPFVTYCFRNRFPVFVRFTVK